MTMYESVSPEDLQVFELTVIECSESGALAKERRGQLDPGEKFTTLTQGLLTVGLPHVSEMSKCRYPLGENILSVKDVRAVASATAKIVESRWTVRATRQFIERVAWHFSRF